MGRYDNLHGDEHEIDEEYRENQRLYQEEHADDWKYEDDYVAVY